MNRIGKKPSRYVRPDGYVVCWAPSHWSVKDKKTKWVLEHRMVMEAKLHRHLVAGEVVHHLNAIKCDNRPANLELFASNEEHIASELTGTVYDAKSDEAYGVRWVTFTRRTNDPKLAWLQRELDKMGISNRRNGESFHAPILEVDENRMAEAWAILIPVDDLDDTELQFSET